MNLWQIDLDLLARFLFHIKNHENKNIFLKEEFALSVIQNIFSDPSLDLLLLKPHPADLLHADALNRLNGLIGFESTVFMVTKI
jgi:hypothetical protein